MSTRSPSNRIPDASLTRIPRVGAARAVRPVVRAARLVLPLATALILASCPWNTDETSFGDYNGVNLIANEGFGASDTATGAPWRLTPGLTAAGNEDGPGGAGVDYARWELTSGTGAYAPPSDAAGEPVYRLEVVNLFANGDFEDPVDPPAGWVESGDGDSNAALETVNPIDGDRSLRLNFELPETRYHLDLADAVGLVDGFEAEINYAFHIDFRLDVDVFGWELNDDTTASTYQAWVMERAIADPNRVFSYPGPDQPDPAVSTTPNLISRDPSDNSLTLLSFGGINTASQGRVEGVFDNIRFVRSGQAHYLRLPVTYRSAGRPELTSGGVYTFSAWIKTDPAAVDPGDPDFGNRFPARHLSVGLDVNPGASSGGGATIRDIVQTVRQPLNEVNAAPGTWHEVSWEISGAGVQIPYRSPGDYVVFDLVVEVGNAVAGPPYQDAGSVLLTAPSLSWQPR